MLHPVDNLTADSGLNLSSASWTIKPLQRGNKSKEINHMTTVPVQKLSEEKSLPAAWFEALQKFFEHIRRRASGGFRCRNGIDVNQVTAKLDKGVLKIEARKAAVEKESERRVTVVAT